MTRPTEWPGPRPSIEQPAVKAKRVIAESSGGELLGLTMSYEDVQRTRLALEMRGQVTAAAEMKAVEGHLASAITKELRRHPVWQWLSQYPGLGGVHVARLVAIIGDPHRFPGRVCGAGHYHSARAESGDVIEVPFGPCGLLLVDDSMCDSPVGPPRPGTGTRALWHYLGLHVVDGRLARRQKGVQSSWTTRGRTACLMPSGIADSIVKMRVPKYRDIYDAAKSRLAEERGVEQVAVIGSTPGPALLPTTSERAQSEIRPVIDTCPGLRPFEVHARARTIAVKAFVGDLLQAMKTST